MKKQLLLSLLFLGSVATSQAQTLLNEDCNALTPGIVSNDLTGNTLGQGGWGTYTQSGGLVTDYQVVNDGNVPIDNAFQIIPSSSANPTIQETRFLFKSIAAPWASRTVGNDIVDVGFDVFSGPTTASLNSLRIVLVDPALNKFLAGLSIAMNTKIVQGLAYFNNGGTLQNSAFNLGAGGASVTLNPNTWYRMGVSFNKTTGQVVFKSTGLFNGTVDGAGAGLNPEEINFIGFPATGNTVAAGLIFDNILITATGSLGVNDNNTLSADTFVIFPNPTSDVVNVSFGEKAIINEIAITDLNGRVVKQEKYNTTSNVQVNLSDLARGMYFVKAATAKGVFSKKVIKK